MIIDIIILVTKLSILFHQFNQNRLQNCRYSYTHKLQSIFSIRNHEIGIPNKANFSLMSPLLINYYFKNL